ncbi:MAG: hypothetical protein JWO08_914 [Verrucomicrobiaceae bacterium]|nr:hypothetical protein [Verrucomicrobiaceae bacterium]
MREVFSSINTSEVNLRRTLLEGADIPTFVRNEDLSSLASLLIGAFHPALCVVNDEQYEKAMALLRTIPPQPPAEEEWQCPACKVWVSREFTACWNCETSRVEPPSEGWQCQKCNESVPNTFDVCWNCETPRPEDPQPSL